jgi:hypothetical protein
MKLKVGDRIRILSVPGEGVPDYVIQKDTVRAYKKLIARGRSVRIKWIDENGQPWYEFRFKRKNGRWEYHAMAIMSGDDNWIRVMPRKKRAIRRSPEA